MLENFSLVISKSPRRSTHHLFLCVKLTSQGSRCRLKATRRGLEMTIKRWPWMPIIPVRMSLQCDFDALPIKRWGLLLHPLNLALTMWLALANKTLANMPRAEPQSVYPPRFTLSLLGTSRPHGKTPRLTPWRVRPQLFQLHPRHVNKAILGHPDQLAPSR